MDVYILRHGKAEDAGQGISDADRKLTKKGQDEIASVGRWITSQGIRFDIIAASPLARAQETAAIVTGALGQRDRPVTWNVLAPGGDTGEVCHEISMHKDARAILLVGHEPQLSTLISRIIGGEENASVALSKGSLARIREFTYAAGPAGELHWFLTAKQMAGLN